VANYLSNAQARCAMLHNKFGSDLPIFHPNCKGCAVC
jgi:hypothetical protein